jgi:hypothetical protein
MRLTIHRDGRVLIAEHGEPDRHVSLDPFALASCFRAVVEFEEGLTSAQLMRALTPWATLLGSAAWMDFGAWAAASGRPHLTLATSEEEQPDEPPIDAVVIHPVLRLTSDCPRRKRKRVEDTIAFAVRWRSSGRYAWPRPNGFGGEDRFCSMSFIPPAQWAHLPLLIERRAMVDALRLGSDAPHLPDLEAAQLTVEPTFFDAVVLGFLDDISFHGSPVDTQARFSELQELVKDAEAMADEVDGKNDSQ